MLICCENSVVVNNLDRDLKKWIEDNKTKYQ